MAGITGCYATFVRGPSVQSTGKGGLGGMRTMPGSSVHATEMRRPLACRETMGEC